MKLLLLGDANSIHINRWVKALCQVDDIEISLFSLEKNYNQNYQNVENFTLIEAGQYIKDKKFKAIHKLVTFTKIFRLKRIINQYKPDVVHAHYASSYGLIGALCGFRPYILSVWGSDVYDFPQQNWLFRSIIQFNLKMADQILSTSNVMRAETKKYTDKSILVTPFGVDTALFKKKDAKKKQRKIIIGTVKTLEEKYGIDTLISTFAILCERNPSKEMELRIAGSGNKAGKYKEQVKGLNLEDKVFFDGRIPNTSVPSYINQMDVYLALSRFESFGVAIVEAMACEVPVVVSNVGGLSEVVDNNVTGFIVPKENPYEAAVAVEKIISDKKIAVEMGRMGRQRVENLYQWDKNVDNMINIYTNILDEN